MTLTCAQCGLVWVEWQDKPAGHEVAWKWNVPGRGRGPFPHVLLHNPV